MPANWSRPRTRPWHQLVDRRRARRRKRDISQPGTTRFRRLVEHGDVDTLRVRDTHARTRPASGMTNRRGIAAPQSPTISTGQRRASLSRRASAPSRAMHSLSCVDRRAQGACHLSRHRRSVRQRRTPPRRLAVRCLGRTRRPVDWIEDRVEHLMAPARATNNARPRSHRCRGPIPARGSHMFTDRAHTSDDLPTTAYSSLVRIGSERLPHSHLAFQSTWSHQQATALPTWTVGR